MGEHLSWGLQDGWRKGPWTAQEDKLLIEYVSLNGEGRWSSVAKFSGLNRSGKSCRLRWVNYLRPDLKRGKITPREEKIIIELHAQWGNRWSTIARSLPGRTDNEIKNYWRTHFKKTENSIESKKKRNNAQNLKRGQKQQQQQQQQYQQEGDAAQGGNHVVSLAQGGQDMVFMYPNFEEQCLYSMLSVDMNTEGFSPETPSESGFGFWSALWNLGDVHVGMNNMCATNQGVQNFN